MTWFMSLLPGKRHFASTNAAIDENTHCKTVTETVTAMLLNTYLENGTLFCLTDSNISRKLSSVGLMTYIFGGNTKSSSTGFTDIITVRYIGSTINAPRTLRTMKIAAVPPSLLPTRLFEAFSFAVST